MTKRRIVQPVTFTENEQYLLEYAKKQGKPFAVYVKNLIKQDMGELTSPLTKDDVVRICSDLIQQYSIPTIINKIIPEKVESKEKEGLGSKGKSAYKNLLGRK